MTIFLEEPRRPAAVSFAGGVAPLSDIASAAFDSLAYVENSNAAWSALERAYDERITAIHEATGAMLQNPLREAEAERRRLEIEEPRSPMNPEGPRDYRALAQERLRAFDGELFALGEKFPLARGAIGADRLVARDAERIAREADARLANVMASRDGLGKWGALLAGGAAASFRDPVMVASLAAGGGPGAARTIAGRLLTVAGKEAIINGASEAAIQPMVQAWREQAGLDHGIDEAIRNVVFATVLGGAFGTAGQGIAEGIRPFMRAGDLDRVSATLPADRLSDPAQAILANDGLRAAGSLAEMREALPPPARGALDAAETIARTDAQRPASVSPDFHDRTVAMADRAFSGAPDEAWPGFAPDAAQVERITTEIYGGPSASRAAGAPAGRGKGRVARSGSQPTADLSLVEFLKARGGLIDHQGELKAIGAAALARKRKGQDRRATLDMAREAAEEAGYIGRAGETQTTSVADLLSAIDRELRGDPAYARGAEAPLNAADDAGRARLEGIVADIARHAGPAVDDALISRAARLAVDEGLEPFDALERVLISDDMPEGKAPWRDGEPLPGWSDEDLLAASDMRGTEPVPDGIADPGKLRPEDADLRELAEFADDELLPAPDGSMTTVGDLRARIAANENMAALVAACRV